MFSVAGWKDLNCELCPAEGQILNRFCFSSIATTSLPSYTVATKILSQPYSPQDHKHHMRSRPIGKWSSRRPHGGVRGASSQEQRSRIVAVIEVRLERSWLGRNEDLTDIARYNESIGSGAKHHQLPWSRYILFANCGITIRHRRMKLLKDMRPVIAET